MQQNTLYIVSCLTPFWDMVIISNKTTVNLINFSDHPIISVSPDLSPSSLLTQCPPPPCLDLVSTTSTNIGLAPVLNHWLFLHY